MCRHFYEDYGLETRVARYHNVYGPMGTYDGGREKAPAALCRKLITAKNAGEKKIDVWGDGEQTRDFTFVENAVQINVKGMLTDNAVAFGKTYNVAIGERFTVNQLYKICQQQLKSDFAATYREPRVGDIRDSLADISLAKDLLGYQPTKKFEDGLIETIKYFKNLYS